MQKAAMITFGLIILATSVFAQAPQVVSVAPTQNELDVSVNTDISVTFDIDMDEATINNSTFVVNARSSGLSEGTITYDAPSRTATFDPIEDLDAGEVVTVVLTTVIQSSGGETLEQGFSWSFTLDVIETPGVFAPYSNYSDELEAWSINAADFDNDGYNDLVIGSQSPVGNSVSVLINNGDGTFASRSVYQTGSIPITVFAADFNGDGNIDLASANLFSSSVSILLNNGDGTFATHQDYPVGEYPTTVFAADLDNDGDNDLAVVDHPPDDNSVSVLINYGDGTFAPHSVYPVGIEPYKVVGADFDDDGDIDLVTSNNLSDNVSVLINNGDATFGPQSVYQVSAYPISVVTADFDGDGAIDLATVSSDRVSVLINNGDGTFASYTPYPAAGDLMIFATDLEGDGDIDIAVTDGNSDHVSIILNDGNGTFGPQTSYPTGIHPVGIFAADLDNDGDMDLATANWGSHDVSILLNAPPCIYVTGDFNGNEEFNIADIISAFSKLKTGSPDPGYVCECPASSGNEWAVAMDVNNSCSFNVADVIAGFSKLKTGEPALVPCEDCPPPDQEPSPNGGDQPIKRTKTKVGDRIFHLK
ncbi:MAG: FG-GAP-like repeat-containing protein [candidate division Zixibacteria bacterium]